MIPKSRITPPITGQKRSREEEEEEELQRDSSSKRLKGLKDSPEALLGQFKGIQTLV